MTNPNATCSVPGCDVPVRASGWCNPHYQRNWRYGDPLGAPTPRSREDRVASFWAKIAVSSPDECWHWTRSLTWGYGQSAPVDGETRGHRIAFMLTYGPLPTGFDVGHTCHDADQTCAGGRACPHRACCNPAHLELQTRRENLRASPIGNTHKMACPHGHLYDEANTRVNIDGSRSCRTCDRDRARAIRANA